jgi:hypothetical protein
MPTNVIQAQSTPNQLEAIYLLPKPKIAEKAVNENKGGPRVRDVLDHIIDLHSLVEMVSNSSLIQSFRLSLTKFKRKSSNEGTFFPIY